MADLRAPEQNRLLGRLADMLRMTEGQASAPEFLPPQLNVMNLVRQLMLPSAETVEKMSYGDPLFRMPQQSRIPITTDKQYLADIVGMVPFTAPAARPSARAMQDLVREIQTTPPVGAVNMAPTPSVPRSDIGFYSQLEAAVQPLQNKGTGQQYLAQIQKSAGVKPEEIQWTGLDTFLRGKQSVTKADIQDYLNANRVDVREVRLGQFSPEQSMARDKAINRYREITDSIADTRQKVEEGLLTSQEARAILEPLTAERSNLDRTINTANQSIATKFSKYTLPGGQNYREILLTLPTSGSGGKRVRVYTQDGTSAVQVMSDADIQRMAESGRRRFEVLDEVSPQGTFQSSHFDQPNILAHMRVNDRVVDGKKTLFIEEIQSDWHQAGRKKGYDTPEARAAEQQKLDNILAERQTLLDEQLRLEKLAEPYTSQGRDAPREIVDQWSIVSNRLNNLQTEQNRLGRGFGQQVPDAPFKTSWHELTLKRAIQEASEKGYDQIAFTTGKTQAARYDLSKQVNALQVMRNTDGNYSLRIKRTGAGPTFETLKSNVAESELSDYIGKDLAQKITQDASGSQGFSKVYSGLDLQVGGEGMKGFYDQILPKSLEKLGKKFNAKVGKTEMDGVEVWQMDITPQMRESVTTKGQPLFAIPAIGTGLLGAGMMQEDEQF